MSKVTKLYFIKNVAFKYTYYLSITHAVIQSSNCPKYGLRFLLTSINSLATSDTLTLFTHYLCMLLKMVWFKLFADIVDRSQFFTRRIALKVGLAGADPRSTDKYSFKSLCS